MILCKYIKKKKHSFYGVKIFETFKRVFLALSVFRVGELSSSKSTATILLKFYTHKYTHTHTHKLRGNAVDFFFKILTYFKITKFPIF